MAEEVRPALQAARTAEVTIHHRGRESLASVRGPEAALDRFRDALVARGFRLRRAAGDRWIFRRPAALLEDDWPLHVEVTPHGDELTIRYFFYIPWAWIAGFVLMMLLVLPFAGIRRADLVLAVGVLAASLAIWRRRFDCAPNATGWQAAPRRRWGATMAELLTDVFDPGGAARPATTGLQRPPTAT